MHLTCESERQLHHPGSQLRAHEHGSRGILLSVTMDRVTLVRGSCRRLTGPTGAPWRLAAVKEPADPNTRPCSYSCWSVPSQLAIHVSMEICNVFSPYPDAHDHEPVCPWYVVCLEQSFPAVTMVMMDNPKLCPSGTHFLCSVLLASMYP